MSQNCPSQYGKIKRAGSKGSKVKYATGAQGNLTARSVSKVSN
jgi:hypothetical protein